MSRNRNRNRNRNRQRIITGREKLTHWPEKNVTLHEKKPASDCLNTTGTPLFSNLILFSGIFRVIFVRKLRTELAIMLQPLHEIRSQMFRQFSGYGFSVN